MNDRPAPSQEDRRRIRIDVTGAVQGVGFRPFVHRLALSEGLAGNVRNTADGVTIEVEGDACALARFCERMGSEIEAPAAIHQKEIRDLPVTGETTFAIAPSAAGQCNSAVVLPDLAPCPRCLVELFDPNDRRYRYPFITCVHCGPRYSLIEALPYDRERTAMRHFPMCRPCEAEYRDPATRRFHAETNACPACGPQLSLRDTHGEVQARSDEALKAAADRLRDGAIVALKGLGGYQLLVDARNEAAVRRLRQRKSRPEKPFALMVGSLADALAIAEVSREERSLLTSPVAPIVLLLARNPNPVAPSVAPENPQLGIMLPATPLHRLLMADLSFPVVATSGNRSDEPIAFRDEDAIARLGDIADWFLTHDRPIVRPVDDSVVRLVAGQETVLRNARGYAPLTLTRPQHTGQTIALGGHQKSAVALAFDRQIVLGTHIGDLDTPPARTAFSAAVAAMTGLYGRAPDTAACDRHPAYFTTQFAETTGYAVRPVPHHLAHVLAGLADAGIEGKVLGVAWDGTGYGDDGTVWGGEFLTVGAGTYRRAAHLLPLRLPGGDSAMREPRRSAIGALHACFGDRAFAMDGAPTMSAFADHGRRVLQTMLEKGINAPLTSSAGRLFDAAASILGLRQQAGFEGQAAMAVEFAAMRATGPAELAPAVVIENTDPIVLDWRPMVVSMVEALQRGESAETLALAFHQALADAIVSVALRVAIADVLLTGGCFQNALLTGLAVDRLRAAGFNPHWHRRVPPNDGGLAVGQAIFAARPLIEETH